MTDVPSPADTRAFLLATTRLLPVPHVPELRLHVADEATSLWEKTEEELGKIGLPPPFWAFAWAGGQALARYLVDNPATVRGRVVLDVASGSGLVAIAAARCGAARVVANDVDLFAKAAMLLNAEANDVTIEPILGDMVGTDGGWDVVLIGDAFYERDMASAMTNWLAALARRGADVLIGDPGRSYLPFDLLESVASYEVPVTRALEDAEIKRSQVWRFRLGVDKGDAA